MNRHLSGWDQESYCVHRDGRPATHRETVGMVDGTPLFEMVCCQCASGQDTDELIRILGEAVETASRTWGIQDHHQIKQALKAYYQYIGGH